MTKYSYLFWITLLGLALLAGLLYGAMVGNLLALLTLVALGTTALISLGVGLTLLVNTASRSLANARETLCLALMQHLQTMLRENAQNNHLLRQAQGRLPAPESTTSLLIDEGLFEEL